MTQTPATTGASEFSRRSLLAALGAGGTLAALGLEAEPAQARSATPTAAPSSVAAGRPVPAVAGLHVTFGADAGRSVTVTWHSVQKVTNPRILLARHGRGHETTVHAAVETYRDGKSGTVVHAHHARVTGLHPDTAYEYLAVHDGATPEFGTFRTAPRGRSAFRFTSFGDQGTPTLGKLVDSTYVNDNLGSPAAGDTTAGVESLEPLLHLFNGDLCYANLATDRIRTWSDFWNNNSRSARHRAWMPAPGNHENERGNGPIGYEAFQTYFDTPRQPGQTDATAGLWYAITAGAVRFVFLANDDVCYQDAGDSYVRGYSDGAQMAWLERTLREARADRDIDWIVVCMHQVAVSTADPANGADLGIREEWLPLFDRYGVDLVVCGHEHHYERSKAIRGQQQNRTRTPIPVSEALDVVDTSRGTVHMVIGGGGTSAPSNQFLTDPPHCRVIVSVSDAPGPNGKRSPTYVTEDAPWVGTRDAAHSYGFASFDVDPGPRPGGLTTITVTYHEVSGPYGALTPVESFRLQRPRSDRR